MTTDYISHEAAEERLNRLERESHHNSVLWPDHVEECREAIRDIPAADVRPVVQGKWIEPDDDYGYLVCSVCEERSPNDERWNFCPNCGADMRSDINGQ